MTIGEVLYNFKKEGIELKTKKVNNGYAIGFFENDLISYVTIIEHRIIDTVFERQEKLEWLFKLIDDKIYIDYIL